MAQGNKIVVSAVHYGRHEDCIIEGTPSPGTVMQLDAAVEPVGGKYTWEVFNGAADGEQTVIAVLLENLRGGLATAAYADGDIGRLYFPLPGDELNMLVDDTAGALAIGDKMIVQDASGLLIETTGTPESEPFVVLATTADPTVDTLVHCMFTGY